MPKFIGRFYFKLTTNDNLLGEWSNSHSSCIRCATEAANRAGEAEEPNDRSVSRFVGDYTSVWCEAPNTCTYSNLVIRPKRGCNGIFTVEWTGPAKFIGEAMLCDDILVGDYRSN